MPLAPCLGMVVVAMVIWPPSTVVRVRRRGAALVETAALVARTAPASRTAPAAGSARAPRRSRWEWWKRWERWERWKRRQPSGDLERDVLGLLEGLAAGLRAGLTPARACAQLVGATVPGARPTAAPDRSGRGGRGGGSAPPTPVDVLAGRLAAFAASGAPLHPALRAAAVQLDSTTLLAAAEGWVLAEQHGAPIVDVLDRLITAVRDSARAAAAIETALAAPRATATLLAVLPLAGVGLGELVGVNPAGVLLGTPIGRVALALGLSATAAGRVWMQRLVRGVASG